MNEQTEIPPGTLTHVGDHRGFQIWRSKDGVYEAYSVWGREEKARPITNGRADIWNGKRTERVILPGETFAQAVAALDRKLEKKKEPKYDPNSTPDMFK